MAKKEVGVSKNLYICSWLHSPWKAHFQEVARTNKWEWMASVPAVAQHFTRKFCHCLLPRFHPFPASLWALCMLKPAQTNSHVFRRVVCALGEHFFLWSAVYLLCLSDPLSTSQSVFRLLVSFTCFFWYMGFILWLPILLNNYWYQLPPILPIAHIWKEESNFRLLRLKLLYVKRGFPPFSLYLKKFSIPFLLLPQAEPYFFLYITFLCFPSLYLVVVDCTH